jgi:hypothetical protein
MLLTFLTALCLFSLHLAAATTISFRAIPSDATNLSKRSNITGVPLENGGNVIYGTTITLGGTSFNVVLDTGRHVYFLFSSLHLLSQITLVPTSGLLVPFPRLKTLDRRSPYRMPSEMLMVRTPTIYLSINLY